jgi:hypothetical protein
MTEEQKYLLKNGCDDLVINEESRPEDWIYVSDIMQKCQEKQLTLTDVSFSIFDKVYMDSPFGRYTGVVKGVEESKVIIESHSPNGKGMMLADYDLTNNDWQKY